MFAGTLFMRKHQTVKCDYSGEDETIEQFFLFREIWQKVTDSKTQFNRILSICCKSERYQVIVQNSNLLLFFYFIWGQVAP